MENLKTKFLEKNALYPKAYEELVTRLTRVGDVSKSLNTNEEQFNRGKAFGSVYECFLYATMVGIKARNQLPFERGAAGKKFLPIKDWKPEDWKPEPLVQYVFMSLLALADFPLSDLEALTEKATDEKAVELVNLMEQYAKGGFELMSVKDKASRHEFFTMPSNVVTFLKDMKPLND